MSSKDKKYQRGRIESNQATAQQNYNEFIDPYKKRSQDLYNTGLGERANILGKYGSLFDSGGMSQEEIDKYFNNIGGPSQAEVPDFAKERAGYTDLADTGGYSSADIQRVRAQAASSSPSFYNSLKAQQDLNQAKMGGANAGGTAGLSLTLARKSAQDAASDKLKANIGLSDTIRTGKESGLTGLTTIDTNRGDLLARNAALMNAYNIARGGVGSDILTTQAKNRLGAAQGLESMYGTSYKPYDQNQSDWLKALGQLDTANLGYTDATIANDKNRGGLAGALQSGESIVGGAAGAWQALKNLFKPGKGKNKDGNKYASAGGGGGDAPSGTPNDAWFRYLDYLMDKNHLTADQAGAQLRQEYESSHNAGESFMDWVRRVHPEYLSGNPSGTAAPSGTATAGSASAPQVQAGYKQGLGL